MTILVTTIEGALWEPRTVPMSRGRFLKRVKAGLAHRVVFPSRTMKIPLLEEFVHSILLPNGHRIDACNGLNGGSLGIRYFRTILKLRRIHHAST